MDKISVKGAFWHMSQQKWCSYVNIYWKDDPSWKTGAFCKHKSSSLHNQAVEVVYSLPRSGRDT